MCTNSVKKIVQKVFQKMYQQKPWCSIGIFKHYDRFPSLGNPWKPIKISLTNIPKKPNVPISNSILPCLEFSRQKARPPARCERRTRVSSITLAEVHGFKIQMEQILWQISSQIHPNSSKCCLMISHDLDFIEIKSSPVKHSQVIIVPKVQILRFKVSGSCKIESRCAQPKSS